MNYEEFIALCRARFSCRNYDAARDVSNEDVLAVLEAARLAPSACNRQPWRFVVVRDEGARAALLAKSRPAFLDAPVVIACCGLHERVWVRPADNKDHTDVDLAIAAEHICLAAAAKGLATCWVCSFDTEAARRVLNLPATAEPVALLPLGYAAEGHEQAPAKIRMDMSRTVDYDTFKS